MNKVIKDIRLYNCFLHSRSISYTNLLDAGLTSHDIKNYLSDGKLIRSSYGNYSITGEAIISLKLVDSIFSQVDVDSSELSTMRKSCFSSITDDFMPLAGFMLYDLERRNFADFLSDLRLFNSISCNSVNYYLDIWYFLSSYICDLNAKETENVRSILANKKFYYNGGKQNEVIFNNSFREALFRHDFHSCYGVLNANSKDNILDLITCSLLKFAFLKEEADRNHIYELIDLASYDDALELLRCNDFKHGLSYSDRLFYIALDDLNRLINDDSLPVINASVNNPLIGDYITSGNYEDALELLKNTSITRNDIYLLKVIEVISEEINRVNKKNSSCDNKSNDCLKHDDVYIDGIIEKVLDGIDCKYKGIIYDLVLVNYLEGFIDSNEINDFVSNLISDGTISIDVNRIIINFYRAIERNSTEEAILYLDIIDRVNYLDNLDIDISLFQKDMVDSMQSSNNSFYRTIASISNGDRSVAISDVISPAIGSSISNLNFDDYNVKCSLIEDGENTRVMFRHFNQNVESDFNMGDADNYYFNGMYEEAISIYEKLFASSCDINYDLLVRTGLSYYATDRLEEAVDYLYLADYYGKRDDFRPLIDSCRERINYSGISIDTDFDKIIRGKTYIKVKES